MNLLALHMSIYLVYLQMVWYYIDLVGKPLSVILSQYFKNLPLGTLFVLSQEDTLINEHIFF